MPLSARSFAPSDTPVIPGHSARPTASLARRVALMGSLGIASMIGLICVGLSLSTTAHERDSAATLAQSEAQAVARMVDAYDGNARLTAERFYSSFAHALPGSFSLSTDGELLLDGKRLAGDFSAVDEFNRTTGGAATIFVRRGQDFVRISTSLRKENGERAVGTPLGQQHPAYARLMAGQNYVGRATLFGKPFMNRYEPIRSSTGDVIGILFVGFDTSEFQRSLEQTTASVHLFQTGGLYIVDPTGAKGQPLLRVHPSKSGQAVSEQGPQAEAALGALLSHEAQARKDGESAAAPVRAPGLLLSAKDDSWAVARQSAATGWWVVAEVSDREALKAHWATQRQLWMWLGVATLLLAGGLSLLLQRWVSRPLRTLAQAVGRVAEGDLSQPVQAQRRDELGQLAASVERMRLQLSRALSSVQVASDSICTASAQVAAGSQDLSSRTETGASNLQAIAASIEELTSAVKHSAAAAQQADELTGQATLAIGRGGELMGQMIGTMDAIQAASGQIGDIVQTIDGIAFQTNILALNAAVESARAGEHGRGFAVVASEVRNLAQRSAEAAREIKGLIGRSLERVEAGTQLARQTGISMDAMIDSIQHVSIAVSEISNAAREQREGISHIHQAVTQLDGNTQQNAALVEESAAAAESLQAQARHLVEVVGGFRLARA